MLSKINLACVGALTLLPHLAIAADATLPKANVESMCQAEQSAAPPGSKASDFQSCVNDERKALTELRRNWARGGSFDATNAGASRETGNSAGSMPRDGTVARP
jgi:hypothetical protein